jgi:hypothetical protein
MLHFSIDKSSSFIVRGLSNKLRSSVVNLELVTIGCVTISCLRKLIMLLE